MSLTGSKLAGFTEGTATTATSPSVSPAANSVVFVSITFQATAGTPSISGISGLGLTWAQAKPVAGFDASAVSSVEAWWAATGGSAPTPGTLVVTFSASCIFDGVVDQVAGGATGIVGGASSVGTSGSGTAAAAPSSPAPVSAANFLYGVIATAGAETVTTTGALTNIGSSTGANELVETQGATGITTSGVKCSGTLSATDNWAAICVEVSASVAGGVAPNTANPLTPPGRLSPMAFRFQGVAPQQPQPQQTQPVIIPLYARGARLVQPPGYPRNARPARPPGNIVPTPAALIRPRPGYTPRAARPSLPVTTKAPAPVSPGRVRWTWPVRSNQRPRPVSGALLTSKTLPPVQTGGKARAVWLVSRRLSAKITQAVPAASVPIRGRFGAVQRSVKGLKVPAVAAPPVVTSPPVGVQQRTRWTWLPRSRPSARVVPPRVLQTRSGTKTVWTWPLKGRSANTVPQPGIVRSKFGARVTWSWIQRGHTQARPVPALLTSKAPPPTGTQQRARWNLQYLFSRPRSKTPVVVVTGPPPVPPTGTQQRARWSLLIQRGQPKNRVPFAPSGPKPVPPMASPQRGRWVWLVRGRSTVTEPLAAKVAVPAQASRTRWVWQPRTARGQVVSARVIPSPKIARTAKLLGTQVIRSVRSTAVPPSETTPSPQSSKLTRAVWWIVRPARRLKPIPVPPPVPKRSISRAQPAPYIRKAKPGYRPYVPPPYIPPQVPPQGGHRNRPNWWALLLHRTKRLLRAFAPPPSLPSDLDCTVRNINRLDSAVANVVRLDATIQNPGRLDAAVRSVVRLDASQISIGRLDSDVKRI